MNEIETIISEEKLLTNNTPYSISKLGVPRQASDRFKGR